MVGLEAEYEREKMALCLSSRRPFQAWGEPGRKRVVVFKGVEVSWIAEGGG